MRLTLFSVLFIPLFGYAQLLEHIGLNQEPQPEDLLCQPGDYYVQEIDESIGYPQGSLVNDFTLYDLEGNAFTLSESLAEGKPVLLVSSSYTCPVFRGKINVLNAIHDILGDQLTVAVIYTVEAHPTDVSPYFGYVNTGAANIEEEILYAQPTTYAERRIVLENMLAAENIAFPIFIDGTCNEWLEHFGPAPNIGYLIGTDGVVIAKHPWFHKYPDSIFCDLQDLISLPNEPDCGNTAEGSFSVSVEADSSVSGSPGETLYAHAMLFNYSSEDVLIGVERIATDIPAAWSTSLCTDICLPPQTSYTDVLLEEGDSLLFTFYFYTDELPASGNGTVAFTNLNNENEQVVQVFYGSSESTGVIDLGIASFEVFPNPCSGFLRHPFGKNVSLSVLNAVGLIQMEIFSEAGFINTSTLESGYYFLLEPISKTVIPFVVAN
ncbi:MAG: hypothetical protein ACKVOR_02345 [Flavobacteriales bacterium]